MKYVMLNNRDQEALMQNLADMPRYLEEAFGKLTDDQATRRSSCGEFSPVEQVWHLADLEIEAYQVRINRLLAEPTPLLANFDGDKIATERRYQTLSLVEGLQQFHLAREQTIQAFKHIHHEQWPLSGELEGVGTVSLCDLPSFLLQHDAAHKTEIETWLQENKNYHA